MVPPVSHASNAQGSDYTHPLFPEAVPRIHRLQVFPVAGLSVRTARRSPRPSL